MARNQPTMGRSRRRTPPWLERLYWAAGIVVALIAVVTLVLQLLGSSGTASTGRPTSLTASTPATRQTAGVEITYPPKYPPEGTRQDRCVTVHGTADLPKGQRLWLVIRTEPETRNTDYAFYLEGDRAINSGREDFHDNFAEDDVFLGDRSNRVDDDKPFLILAVITTGDASGTFQDLMDADNERIGPKLPVGSTVVDSRKVIRKKPSRDNCPL